MKQAKINQGFTLIEVMIALAVFSIGLLGVMAMQTHFIKANSTAMNRSDAHTVALSFIEAIQNIAFDDPVLQDGAAVINENNATKADYGVISADLQAGATLGSLANAYTVTDDANHILTDTKGRQFQVFWNIADQTIASGTAKTIRIFVTWISPTGNSSSVISLSKYNNITL